MVNSTDTIDDRKLRIGLVLLITLGTGWVIQPRAFPTRRQHEMRVAARALAGHRFDVAQAAANRLLERDPSSPSALLLAGFAAAGRSEHETAVGLLQRVGADSSQAFHADLALARQWLGLGKVEQAEELYRRILTRDPGHLEANRRLGFMLQAQGRTWESQACLAPLLFQGDFKGDELLGVSSTERYFFADQKLERTLHNAVPGDLLIRLAEVRSGLLSGRESEVRPLLEQIVTRYPWVAEARARLGRLIAETGDRGEFLEWNAEVTPEHEFHPEIWFVRGLFARREGTRPAAVRCFLETLIRSPNHLAAHHQISGCLLQMGQPDFAKTFADRVPLLNRIDIEINLIRKTPTAENALRLIRLLQELGRHWEAAGWAHLAARFEQPAGWSQAVYFEEAKKLIASAGLTARDSQPALRLDLSQFPLPEWPRHADSTAPPRPSTDGTGRFAAWRFTDRARAAGLEFAYYDGTSMQSRMRHVIQTVGGGAGVIDFDGDGWPDLYLTQANDWRRPVSESTSIDRLFRNTGAGEFVDVTAASGLGDPGFSHGMAVADYDNDGWPDLYVANLGPNRFYHNNGDGTFTEISASNGTEGDEWSTSCALADLTGDGLPDLFVVNYLDRDFVVKNPCFVKGIEMACTPDSLPAATNRLYVNLGDGRFADVSRETGILAEQGNGLGLVVADFCGEGRLSVFVGNDTTPNFLFRNSGTDANGHPRFEEQGMVAGVAFNAGGSALASMGIACGDADGDGRLDLFVSTYMNDADTLFVQQSDGSFVDGTRQARLHGPTFNYVGFGSQFLDVDNDGWEDLVVTNGHVTPPTPDGPDDESDKMPTQLLANLGDGTFTEVSADTLGPYFQIKALGRGLTELDWNRDGRQDFCVSYIHSPVALATNESATDDHRLVVLLVGIRGARDAFGAIASVRAGERTMTRQLIAGSGYMAANERRLWFGLGAAQAVDELTITWPGGAVQRFERLKADQEILVIEGRAQPVMLRTWVVPR